MDITPKLLWRGDRWRISSFGFAWWLLDRVITGKRGLPALRLAARPVGCCTRCARTNSGKTGGVRAKADPLVLTSLASFCGSGSQSANRKDSSLVTMH